MGEEGGRGEARGGRRGGKPAVQHGLNYSSTSEWGASDGREMEGKDKGGRWGGWEAEGRKKEKGGDDGGSRRQEQEGCMRRRKRRKRG